jgi:hypothetical protein
VAHKFSISSLLCVIYRYIPSVYWVKINIVSGHGNNDWEVVVTKRQFVLCVEGNMLRIQTWSESLVNDITTTGRVGMGKLWQVAHVMATLLHVFTEFPPASTLCFTVRLICLSTILSCSVCVCVCVCVQNGESCAICSSV